ncbi:Uncharacterised protein [Serratia plymuthica]|uniref:Uncharacterized protein n=1 Tax=Serratia plymuthica TaxID=82996 RepID=A0A2X4V8M2_SERPL|nr:Uncharacterised protein [Serratia plymuthica]
MAAILQFAAECFNTPGMQPDNAFVVLPLVAGDVIPYARHNPQLFIQFTCQRLRLAFAFLDLTAGKLPQAGLIAVCIALSQ